MKRLKIFATLLVAIALSFTVASAQSVKYDDFRIINKSLTVGKKTAKAAPRCAWLEIGPDTGGHKGVIFNPIDSAKVDTPYKTGLIFYSKQDSCFKFWNGKRMRKVALQ